MADDAAALLGELGISRGARGRRLHGGHDHPGPRDQPPRALPQRLLHHVDHRGPGGRSADRRGVDRVAAAGGDEPGRGHSGRAWRAAASSVRRGTRSTSAILRERAAAAYDRSYCPEGTVRQLGAILGSPDRTEGLHGVDMPFLVVHGEADPLVTPSGGDATAAAVPGSRLLTFPGMGHDLPEALWDPIIGCHRGQHGSWPRSELDLRRRGRWRLRSPASQVALGLGVRANVSRSTSDDAELRPVAHGPLEVVEQRPVRVATDVDAVGQGLPARRTAPGARSRCAARRPSCRCRSR